MAIETLKGVEKIDGFNVVVMDELREKYPDKFNEKGGMDYKWFEAEIRPKNFIYIRNDVNSIAFTIQKGPIKENGVNGCQVDTLVQAARLMLYKLNEKFPCDENEQAINALGEAVQALERRRLDREKRGVEGLNKA